MNELSRMDRHRSRNKGRKKDKVTSKDAAFRSKENKEDLNPTLGPRAQHNSNQDHNDPDHRTHEVDVLRRSRSGRVSNEGMLDEESAPSRTNTYPSHRVRMSKWFVNSLIVIFILLMAGLLIWGLIGAPPLEEIL